MLMSTQYINILIQIFIILIKEKREKEGTRERQLKATGNKFID